MHPRNFRGISRQSFCCRSPRPCPDPPRAPPSPATPPGTAGSLLRQHAGPPGVPALAGTTFAGVLRALSASYKTSGHEFSPCCTLSTVSCWTGCWRAFALVLVLCPGQLSTLGELYPLGGLYLTTPLKTRSVEAAHTKIRDIKLGQNAKKSVEIACVAAAACLPGHVTPQKCIQKQLTGAHLRKRLPSYHLIARKIYRFS